MADGLVLVDEGFEGCRISTGAADGGWGRGAPCSRTRVGWCSGRMNMLRGFIGGVLRRRAMWMLPTHTVHNMGESISDRPKQNHDRPTTAGCSNDKRHSHCGYN
ncbi:hypothetical protein TRIUR3_31873 [Triticum urartu]|uniref:Uncharacterized protein n=1 Tax=Triticum urartu TaxID=4572 RepID=M7ZHP4_TRIUA|nr:hypothetical protein TRIUR3_31873 [Triticum urartu]